MTYTNFRFLNAFHKSTYMISTFSLFPFTPFSLSAEAVIEVAKISISSQIWWTLLWNSYNYVEIHLPCVVSFIEYYETCKNIMLPSLTSCFSIFRRSNNVSVYHYWFLMSINIGCEMAGNGHMGDLCCVSLWFGKRLIEPIQYGVGAQCILSTSRNRHTHICNSEWVSNGSDHGLSVRPQTIASANSYFKT